MVGDIADRFLATETRARIAKLLDADRLADGQLSGRRTLGEVANWADEIKDTEWGKRRASWHYDDVPLCEAAEYSRYCRSGRCASAQLARQIEILGNERARPGQRNEALKWVVHLVADLHQPLHAVWDVGMVRRLIADRGGERAIVSAPIADRNRDAWEKGSIPEWTAESHRIARDTVYPLLPVAGSCSSKIVGVVAIDQTYYAKVASLIEIQIKKAGVRLARVLNETLGR